MSTQIVIGDISAPIYMFVSDRNDILAVTFSRSVDVVGAELSIDVLTPVVDYPLGPNSKEVVAGADFSCIRSNDGFIMCTNRVFPDLRLLPYGTPVSYYNGETLMAKAYVKNVQRTGPSSYRINAISAIGLLDAQYHYGDLYNAENPKTFAEVLADVIGGAVPYTVDEALGTQPVYGWLPYATRRKNLHKLLFQAGAMVGRNADGDMHIRYITNDEAKVVPDERVYINGEVDYSALASEVQVTEHSFMSLASDETVVEYDNSDGSETANHTVIAFRNAPLHDLTVTGTLTIEESGVNYAIVSGTGVLSGKRYTHSTRVLTVEAEGNADRKTNVVSSSECTLVTVLNSANVAARLLAYYASRKTVSASIVLQDERPGDLLALKDPYNEAVTGFLATTQATVSSIIKANCTIITDFVPPQGGNNFTDALLYTGTDSIDFETLLARYPDKGNDLVQAALIQGGHGGYSGGDGTHGTDGISAISGQGTPGVAGEGGAGGSPGEGGKVLTVSFHVNDLATKQLSFSCGIGGESDREGGETTLGDWTSADGAITANGVANIFTGEIFGRSGELAGISGNPGADYNNQSSTALSYEGETWYTGARGSGASGQGSASRWTSYGGFGGGPAVGENGGGGANAVGAIPGIGGDGADATDGTDATQYGCGGNGGHGGGGAGAGGWCYDAYSGGYGVEWAVNGDGGKGGKGGKGGDGLLMILV